MTGRWLMVSSFALAWLTASADAQPIEVGPGDDLEAAMNALGPGDELVLAGGTYALSGRFGVSVTGSSTAPIVIQAKDGERPHLRREAADQNVVDFDRAEHVVVRGLEFSGGSAGVRLSQVHHFTLEGCEIHDTGDVALRANDSGVTYESLRILSNHIHHTNATGEGMYLGCNSDACRLANSLIEGNYVHHTNQASVTQGDGIEIKEGSYGNVVRDNVIHDTNYPCILVYSTVGNGEPNVLEGNLLWGCGDHGIQAAADARIRNNVVLGAAANGIAMQPHQAGAPSNLEVVHNTVLQARNHAVSVSGIAGSVLVANNALYAQGGRGISVSGGSAGLTLAGNVGVGGVGGASGGFVDGDLALDFVAAGYGGAPSVDVFPAEGGALVGAGDADHVVELDFNGTARGGTPDVGAYAYATGGNPGWSLSAGFKRDSTMQPSLPDAGTVMADGGTAAVPDAGGSSDGATAGSPAGLPGDAAGGVGAAGATGPEDAGGTQAAAEEEDSGCGCRLPGAAGRRAPGASGAFLVALLVSIRSRRRRQARGPPR